MFEEFLFRDNGEFMKQMGSEVKQRLGFLCPQRKCPAPNWRSPHWRAARPNPDAPLIDPVAGG